MTQKTMKKKAIVTGKNGRRYLIDTDGNAFDVVTGKAVELEKVLHNVSKVDEFVGEWTPLDEFPEWVRDYGQLSTAEFTIDGTSKQYDFVAGLDSDNIPFVLVATGNDNMPFKLTTGVNRSLVAYIRNSALDFDVIGFEEIDSSLWTKDDLLIDETDPNYTRITRLQTGLEAKPKKKSLSDLMA